MQRIKKINWRKWLESSWPYLAIIAAVWLLAEIQISNRGVILDIDTMFHYNRFNDIAEQFRTGKFSYFQNNFSFEQSGRVINAMYGPLFAYLNGFLVFLLGSWYRYQIISYFLISIVAGSGMYLLARKARSNKLAATLVAILYINIGGVQAWFDHTNLMAWGAAFAPYVFIEGVNMIKNREKPIRWLRLALIMTIVGQTHLLSTLLLALCLVPLFIVGFIRTQNKREMVVNLLKAIGLTLLLTANVWGGLLLILGTNNISPTLGHHLALYSLQISGYGTLRNTILGPTLFLLLVQIIYAILTYKKSLINTAVTAEGAILLLLSSPLIPWKLLQENFKFLANYLQFPHRLLIAAYPLILLGIAISISQFDKRYKIGQIIAICGLSLVILENFGTNYARIMQRTTFNRRAVYEVKSKKYYNNKNIYKQKKYFSYVRGLHGKYQTNGIKNTKYGYVYVKTATRGDYYKNTLDTGKVWRYTHYSSQRGKLFSTIIKVNPDYLPTYHKKLSAIKVDYYYIKRVIKPRESGKFSYRVLNNGRLQLSWKGKTTKNRSLPLIMYKQSQLSVNGRSVSPRLGYIGTPIVKQRKGQNTAILQFKAPIWFNLLLIVTILSWLSLVIYGIHLVVKNRKE